MSEFADFELSSPDSIFQEGIDLMESDHFEEALRAFDIVVGHQPYNADALFHRGTALINLRRHEEAVAAYQRAIDIMPAEPNYHSHRGFALMLAGRHDEALEALEIALRLQPDHTPAKVYKACALAEKKNLGAARALLEEVLAAEPDETEARRHYATILAALGEDIAAFEQLNRLLAANPNHADVLARKAAILLRAGRTSEAIRCLREVVALNPADIRAYQTLTELHLDAGARPAAIAIATEAIDAGHDLPIFYLLRGRAYLDQKCADQAITDLRRARELDDRAAEVHYQLARAFIQVHRLRQAIQSAGRAVQIAPAERRYLFLKASLHHQLGDYDLELQYLNQLIDGAPRDYRLTRMKADNQLARGQIAAAITTLRTFLSRESNHPRALLRCALLCERIGDHEQAARQYRRLLQRPHPSADSFLAAIRFLLHQRELAEAETVAARATAHYPDHPALAACRGLVLQVLDKHLECICYLQQFLAHRQATPDLCGLLGRSHHCLHRFEEALKWFEMARALPVRGVPGMAPNFHVLEAEARTLQHLDRTAEAIRLVERHAGAFDRFTLEYDLLLGSLCEHIGDRTKSIHLYEQSLRNHPHHATLHFRLARAHAHQRDRLRMIRHLHHTMSANPDLAAEIKADPVFERYALYPSLNRLLGGYYYRRDLRFLILLAVGSVLAVCILQTLRWLWAE